jgi:hypothetical protein
VAQSRETGEWLSLIRGSEVVGYVCIEGCDNLHILGRFRAGPAFAQYEELLAETYRRWAADADDWLDALEAVDGLGLRLVGSSGQPRNIRDFQLEALEQVRDPGGVPVEFKFIGAEPNAAPDRGRR